MKPHAVLALALLMPAATHAQPRTVQKTCPVVTEAEIAAQFDRFNAAWATGNPDTVTALFTPTATLLATVSNEERNTPDEIRDYFVTFLKGAPVGTIKTSTIEIDCRTAKRSGEWYVELSDAKGTRSSVPARFSFLYVWDGQDWKIAHLHSSVRPAKS